MWRIRDLSTLLASIFFVVRLLAFAALAAGFVLPFVRESALVSSSTSAFGIMLAGNRRAVRTFVIAFGTLSRPSRAVAESSVCVHHCLSSSFALDDRVELSKIIRRKQICDFVHVVEVSDSARHRLQGLHHCLFRWRASCRLQLLEVCKPLSQCQQRLVPAGDGLGKPLVKRCRVLCRAGQDFFVQHSQDHAT